MPALTHGRVKNGHNGHSSKCGADGQPCGGQAYNPLDKGKTYRCVAPAVPVPPHRKKKRCPQSTGASQTTKFAWLRRAFKICHVSGRERADNLSKAINSGKNLITLVNEGFTANDFIELFGFFGAIEYIFSNTANAQDVLNNEGIPNSAILSAGVIDNGAAGYDFSNFSAKDLFEKNGRVRFTQVIKSLIEVVPEAESRSLPLSPNAKLEMGIELEDLYDKLTVYQKTNLETFVTAIDPSYAGLFAKGIFNFIHSIVP